MSEIINKCERDRAAGHMAVRKISVKQDIYQILRIMFFTNE